MAVTDHGGGLYEMNAAADTLGATTTLYIDWIEWISKGATAGDDLLVQDGDGNTIQPGVADGANFHQIYPVKQVYTDITLATIDSGSILVKTKKHADNI
jgi:hypothetical protein